MSWRAQGMRAWLLQRLTAVYMIVFAISFIVYLVRHAPIDFLFWQETFNKPSVAIAATLFFIAMIYHAWVGMRDILVDYVQDTAIRFTILVLIGLALVAMALWVVLILLSMVTL